MSGCVRPVLMAFVATLTLAGCERPGGTTSLDPSDREKQPASGSTRPQQNGAPPSTSSGDAKPTGNADKPGDKRAEPRPAAGRWELQKSGIEDDLYAVTFIDEQYGWAVGTANTVLATTDGGKTWKRQTSRDPDGPTFHTVQFTGPKVGWVATEDLKAILRTTDGGKSWAKVPIPVTDPVATGFCRTATVGETYFYQWANYVYRTDDGGKSWKTVCEKFPAALGDWGTMWFADTSNGCVVWNGRSFATTKDGGKTWKTGKLDADKAGDARGRVQFINVKVGWLLPPSGTIHVTADGGENWQPQPLGHDSANSLVGFHFADASVGHVLVAAADSCEVRRTTDGGKTWHSLGKLRNPDHVRGVSFPTGRHGWVVGHKGYIEHYSEPDAK